MSTISGKEQKEIEERKKENLIKASHNFLTSYFSLSPRTSSQRIYEWSMEQREKKGRHTFLLVLIYHWSKFATMSNNPLSFPGVHVEHLLSLDDSHAEAVRKKSHILWQEVG